MKITIISVGSRPPHTIQSQIDDYQKRLPKHVRLQWVFVKNGSGSDPVHSKQQEAEMILKNIPERTTVILLDESGVQLDNPALSKRLFSGKDQCIIIGGAYGVTQRIFERSDLIWALSPLVFPHQLVRLIAAEQIYRSYAISVGHPYHHSS